MPKKKRVLAAVYIKNKSPQVKKKKVFQNFWCVQTVITFSLLVLSIRMKVLKYQKVVIFTYSAQ